MWVPVRELLDHIGRSCPTDGTITIEERNQ